MYNRNSRLLAGLILLVIGAGVFAYGLVTYNAARGALGGAVHGINTFLGTTSKAEQQAIITMVAGGAVAVFGVIFFASRRGSRR